MPTTALPVITAAGIAVGVAGNGVFWQLYMRGVAVAGLPFPFEGDQCGPRSRASTSSQHFAVRDSALSSPVGSRFFKLPLDGKHGSADLLVSLLGGAVLFFRRPYLPGDAGWFKRCGYRQAEGDAAAVPRFATVRLLM